jgi:hypothetical protein
VKSRSVLDQLIDLAMQKPPKERARMMLDIANDPNISSEGAQEFVDAVGVELLITSVRDLMRTSHRIDAKTAARSLHVRSRPAFARRLRQVGTFLGSIAVQIEDEENGLVN